MIKTSSLKNQALDAQAAQHLVLRNQRLRPILSSQAPNGRPRSLAELATGGPQMVSHPLALARWRAA